MMGFVGLKLRILFFILREMEVIDGSEARKVTRSDLSFEKCILGRMAGRLEKTGV